MPSTFSERLASAAVVSTSPPNQISEPFGNVAYQSDLLRSQPTPGNASRMTFGNVSSTMLALQALNDWRKIAWREVGAFNARQTVLRTCRNVLPEREPPNSMTCFAPPAISACASSCLAVRLNVVVMPCRDDRDAAGVLDLVGQMPVELGEAHGGAD